MNAATTLPSHEKSAMLCNKMITYKLTKNFSLVIEGESVPEYPFEASLLQISTLTN